jgi:hypothetical protein
MLYHSSLVKAAMNAVRVCKLRNGVSNFFFFHWPKAEQRPWRTCQLRRDQVFEARIGAFRIVNFGMKKKCTMNILCSYLNCCTIVN